MHEMDKILVEYEEQIASKDYELGWREAQDLQLGLVLGRDAFPFTPLVKAYLQSIEEFHEEQGKIPTPAYDNALESALHACAEELVDGGHANVVRREDDGMISFLEFESPTRPNIQDHLMRYLRNEDGEYFS